MQVFTCLWNLTLLGSSDLLFIDLYDTLIQSHACSNSRTWRNLFWNKIMATHMLKHHQCHIHIWEVALMIPHSYLVYFELVQTCCLSSYAMHTLYFDHTRTQHQSLFVSQEDLEKALTPLKRKRKKESESSCSWILVRAKKKKRKGKDDKSKSIDDGQVSLFTHAHDQSTWMAWLLRDTLFEPAK